MIERSLTYNDLSITLSDVYAALGCKNQGHTSTPEGHNDLESEVRSILTTVAEHQTSRLAFLTTPASVLEEFHPGRIIERQLQGSEALCWFVATAGQWFEDYQQQLMHEGDMLKVYIANELGSLIAERTADRLEEALEEQISPKHLSHTNRFSPGYCGWPLNEQQQLFALFHDAGVSSPCGITLTESSLMLPIKSVSGVIGIGHHVKKHDYQCNICGLESCYKRRVKTNR